MPSLSYNEGLFNVTPYYDDFNKSNNYLKALFRPGRAVQARELTQIQTILQSQIESFGDHIFEDGAVILGGGISESKISFARIDTNTSVSPDNLQSLVGQKIHNADSGVIGRVYHVLAGSTLSSDPNQIVFFQYLTQGSFETGTELGTTGSGNTGITFNVAPTSTTVPSLSNESTLITVDDGLFYIDGYFVESTKQRIVPHDFSGDYREFNNPTSSVGWGVSRDVVTSETDTTLLDPAGGFNNYNAPGSDRYKIDLTLKQIPFVATIGDAAGLTFDTTNYVELLRMVGGSTTKKVRYTEYAELEETLARRTFDESGNYTVDTPSIRLLNHGDAFTPADDTKFAIGIDSNKSYVGGYEVDTQSTAFLPLDKPRDIGKASGEVIDTDFGNYVLVDETDTGGYGKGVVGPSDDTGWSLLTDQKTMELFNKDSITIGTTNIRTVKRGLNNQELRAYLFNTAMSGEHRFSETRYIVSEGGLTTSGEIWFGVKSNSQGFTGPFQAGSRSLMIPTIGSKVVDSTGFHDPPTSLFSTFIVQKESGIHIPEQTGSEGQTGSINIAYHDILGITDNSQFIVVYGVTAGEPAEILDSSDYNIIIDNSSDSNKLQLKIVNDTVAPVGGATASVIYPVQYFGQNLLETGINPYRTVVLTTVASRSVQRSGERVVGGIAYGVFPLTDSHIRQIDSVSTAVQNVSIDLTNDVILDTGDRQSCILNGELLITKSSLEGEPDDDNAAVNVSYKYFLHSGIGPVTVDSYMDAGLVYEQLPTFTDPESGGFFDSKSCLDFRPVQNSNNKDFTEFGIPFHNLQANTEVNYSYFLPRIDKVSLCRDRTYRVAKGISSINPEAPQTTEYDMDLYYIVMKPYVFDVDRDVKVKYIDNRRFTMRQIGEIEERVERVEIDKYLETLQNDAIARASGDNIFAGVSTSPVEEGVFVDDFSGHAFGDVTLRDYNCSMDTSRRGLRPPYVSNSIRLHNDSPSGLNISGDGIATYAFAETAAYNDQTPTGKLKATGIMQINPFGATDFLGFLKSVPSSDTFYDTSINPRVLVNSIGENNVWEINNTAFQEGRSFGHGSVYQGWVQHWIGQEEVESTLQDVNPDSRSYQNPLRTVRSKMPGRITEVINDKTVDKSIVHYMRSVGITFSAEGLLPDSTVYAFFDGELVGSSAEGYQVDSNGKLAETRLVLNGSTYLTGPKLLRITDSQTDTLSETKTAADFTFNSSGLLNGRNLTVSSTRTPQTRRKSVTSPGIISDSYEQNLDDNFEEIVNGLEPLAQEIIVNPGVFPLGMFINSVQLWFKKVDDELPVTIQIRPMVNGSPHPSVVVPFSTTTLVPTVTNNGPNLSGPTRFQFSSPVFLAPGKYAICLISNSSDHQIFRSVVGESLLDVSGNIDTTEPPYTLNNSGLGIRLGSLYLPLNNGSRVRRTNEVLCMAIDRCSFFGASGGAESRTLRFIPDTNLDTSKAGQIINFTCNDQLFTSQTIRPLFTFSAGVAGNRSNIQPNKDIELDQRLNVTNSTDLALDVEFNASGSNQVSPVIDTERVSAIISDRKSSTPGNDIAGETQPDSAGANTVSRYVSKIIGLENKVGDDMRIYLKVGPNGGNVQVFVKTDSVLSNFDQNDYTQLFRDGGTDPTITSNTTETMTFAPSSGTSLGEFTKYSVKVVIEVDDDLPEDRVPIIQDLRAVPLKRS
tara:strand:- start:170 stop:5206 length:5037 start_codon:yes stop_codon:yes gene_type:complete